ncbi:Lon protease 1 [Sodalis glossinidius str. 'morsitans']|uniref:endopeptidase La n=1 Tax=Sodalis glossinidius (strain morsitans) TaxID=343509 RepID=Q2NU73_SODGM|nr:Lon protease family protein [Sodalis glossinidius]BAE74302.1 putative ATP-dependent protease [Sodalis glossinidius str. 'morsitans']CRL44899.1 Lon protease 1 [Sodalis glossinidius str. 'morsitans']
MTNKKLEWKYLLPDLADFAAVFDQPCPPLSAPLATLQARLMDGLAQFCHSRTPCRFMLLTAQEEEDYFQLIAETVKQILPAPAQPVGSRYVVTGMGVSEQPATKPEDNFAAHDVCVWQSWLEYEQLFGALRCYRDAIDLQPGLVHHANGGVLIVGARALTNQPLLWLRLKQMILRQRFDWLPADDSRPLPVSVPSMPLNLRLIVLGDREGLADLNDLEPELTRLALYGEFESELRITEAEEMAQWCGWVNMLAQRQGLPALNADAWPTLIRQSVRYSGDQCQLPLCPQWLTRRLKEAALYGSQQALTAAAFSDSERTRLWRESYLSERMQDEIAEGQIMVETEGQVVGQVNALSVLDFPGHPLPFGEPSRISCVVHLGDGEINDVERKAELGGNIHAKGMMIMQAFLMSALELDQQLPFSASLVFEQSYGEVDGDSASLAEGVALISALADKPINQQIAVTGSVDQFGRVQPIGGVNEKIESFFALCQSRELTGAQGVILPTANVRHLCLHDDVIVAVREGQFSLWAVDTIDEALEIMTALPFDHDKRPSLLASIRERIANVNLHERQRLPWCFRWLNWFNQS